MSSQLGKEFPREPAGSRSKLWIVAGTFFAARRAGHTLVEIAVALSVVAILVGIGWGLLQSRLSTFRMFRVARMLHADLVTARALALDTNREVRVRFVSADSALDPEDQQHGAWDVQVGNRGSGSTQWDTLPVDVDGVVDVSQGERSLEEGGADESPAISLAQWPSLEDDAVVFTPRGWLGNRAGDLVDGEVVLEVVNKRALADGRDERVRVTVVRSGLVGMQAVAP